MIQQIFEFIKSLSDRAFRGFVTLAIVVLALYAYRIDSKLGTIVANDAQTKAVTAIQIELAVKEQRISSLERQIQAQWKVNSYYHGEPNIPDSKWTPPPAWGYAPLQGGDTGHVVPMVNKP